MPARPSPSIPIPPHPVTHVAPHAPAVAAGPTMQSAAQPVPMAPARPVPAPPPPPRLRRPRRGGAGLRLCRRPGRPSPAPRVRPRRPHRRSRVNAWRGLLWKRRNRRRRARRFHARPSRSSLRLRKLLPHRRRLRPFRPCRARPPRRCPATYRWEFAPVLPPDRVRARFWSGPRQPLPGGEIPRSPHAAGRSETASGAAVTARAAVFDASVGTDRTQRTALASDPCRPTRRPAHRPTASGPGGPSIADSDQAFPGPTAVAAAGHAYSRAAVVSGPETWPAGSPPGRSGRANGAGTSGHAGPGLAPDHAGA
jgi:hypothetical protein